MSRLGLSRKDLKVDLILTTKIDEKGKELIENSV